MRTYHGKACVRGHGTLRYKAGGACVECSKKTSKDRWASRDEKWKKQRRENYATDGGRQDRRARNLRRNYGLTLEEYDVMALLQDNRCAICHLPPNSKHNRLVVDHDHVTGKIRALLCPTCNTGLGAMKDNPQYLQSAIHYLHTFSCRN